MALAECLADKSALARLGQAEVSARLTPLIEKGLVATCSIVDLEMLYSARSARDYREVRFNRSGYELIPLEQPIFDRAIDVQAKLAERSQHRGVSIPDLIVAAAAERSNLTVLHYDADFELIGAVTGQPMEWVVPRGTVP